MTAVEAVILDLVRHEFEYRELRLLLLILVEGQGERLVKVWRGKGSWFETRSGIRNDKLADLFRRLERARVLKRGWEGGEFVLETNCDLWKRAEIAPGAVLAQAPLDLPSKDGAIVFEQSLAQVNFAARAAGVLPGGARADAGLEAGAGLNSPHGGVNGQVPMVGAEDPPRWGDKPSGCECPHPRTFPPNIDAGLRESLIGMRLCYECARRRGLVRSTSVRTLKEVQQRTNEALEVTLGGAEWQGKIARLAQGGAGFVAEVRGQVARGYQPKSLHGWLQTVLRKYQQQGKAA